MGRKDDSAAGIAEAAERAQRNTTLLVASCERSDGSSVRVRVRNISGTGLKGECPEVVDFAADEHVKVRFANIAPIAGQIVRCERGEVGIRFDRPIDMARLAEVRSTVTPPAQSPRAEAVGAWIDHNERLRKTKGGRPRSV